MSILILGAGVSGAAAGRRATSLGSTVIYYDEDPKAVDRLGDPMATFLPTEWSDDFLVDVTSVITSPGFPPQSAPLVAASRAGIPVTTEAGFALDTSQTPYIAITGTNGKTTVTEAATEMLRRSGVDAVAIGNIGTPVSDVVDSDAEVFVIELSSFQLHWMDIHPRAAAVLNIAPDHLDWHGSEDAYANAKARIFEHMTADDTLFVNAVDPVVMALAAKATTTVVLCDGSSIPDGGNGVESGDLVVGIDRYTTTLTDPTYLFDLVIAASLAAEVGATADGIQGTIDRFSPGAHRREVVGIVDGVTYVNDSKATNPHATVASVTAFDNVRLLAGGRNKELDLSPIAAIDSIDKMYAFGESGPELAAAAVTPVSLHPSMVDAVGAAHSEAREGDTVLLAPGCASFDEFSNYAERGRVFSDLVASLGEGSAA